MQYVSFKWVHYEINTLLPYNDEIMFENSSAYEYGVQIGENHKNGSQTSPDSVPLREAEAAQGRTIGIYVELKHPHSVNKVTIFLN